MLYLATCGKKRKVAATRNAHKTFLSAAAMLDLAVDWLYPEDYKAYLSCDIDPDALEHYLSSCEEIPAAVYVTSPDYLGNVLDIEGLAEVCHRHGTLLLVDNAHGAYLKFLPNSRHPMDFGADLCCDSAHKTLPVLTGGAYLHIRDAELAEQAKNALALFGSTSPSYLILQSLDAANRYIADGYPEKLAACAYAAEGSMIWLNAMGYTFRGQEAIKMTIVAKAYGYTGTELAQYLRQNGIECEFADPDFLVLMLTPAITQVDLERLEDALTSLPRREPILTDPPSIGRAEKVLSIREALFSPAETIPVEESEGRILAAPSVGCPPAVPIVVCGERIDENAVCCFRYYGIESCTVVK